MESTAAASWLKEERAMVRKIITDRIRCTTVIMIYGVEISKECKLNENSFNKLVTG